MSGKNVGKLLLAAGATFGYGVTANADTMGVAQDQLMEVSVTAQRVQTSESKTPVSMEVLQPSELLTKGVVDIQTLSQSDPSINFDTISQPVTLRRIGRAGHVLAGLSIIAARAAMAVEAVLRCRNASRMYVRPSSDVLET